MIWLMGSPPRMRGRGRRKIWQSGDCGITPAYAGKSTSAAGWMPHKRDHPRVCGEERGLSALLPCHQGSPPRMRGRVDSIETGDLVHGITPAYAGKSGKIQKWPCAPWDHPRVCGEEWGGVLKEAARKGSPPRMRGRGVRHREGAHSPGITPAYAGKSPILSLTLPIRMDHPRVCGEEVDGGRNRSRQMGSPPRMRGRD